ncbi:MAG: outer membrane protein assembly factor BamD [Phycisphaerales bacterium]|nr:outer membrane protein assembly factor BamD [Phycisphaerales bacterium]
MRRGLFAILALLVVVPTAAAQDQEYVLGDDDAWKLPQEVDPASPEGQAIAIRLALANGEYERVNQLATSWLERNDPNPFRAEVLLARGDALLGMGDEYKALYDYEAVATLYPGSDVFVTALEREFDIAVKYANGMKRKLWGIRWIGTDDEAQELLIRIQERLPSSNLAERAGMELADYYFRKREMRLAADSYDLFIENYPRSAQISKARLRLIYAFLASFKGPEFDASGLIEARGAIRALEVTEPATAQQIGSDALLVRIDESIAAKLLVQSQWYFKRKDPIAAELCLRRLIDRFPRSVAAREGAALAEKVLAQLPERIRATAPDYKAFLATPPPEAAELEGRPEQPGIDAPARPGSEPPETSPPDATAPLDPTEVPPGSTSLPPQASPLKRRGDQP